MSGENTQRSLLGQLVAAIDVFAKNEWVEFGAPIEDVTFPNGDKGCPVVEEEGLGRLTTLELKLGSYPHTNRDLRPPNALQYLHLKLPER